jgi:hypothetical protein
VTSGRRRLAGAGLAALLTAVAVDALVYRFVQFGGRAKAAECRAQLPGVLTRALQADGGAAGAWGPLRDQPRRYAYVVDAPGPADGGTDDAVLPPNLPPELARDWTPRGPLPSGAVPGRSGAGLTVVCAGDLDGDDAVDVWSAADFPRRVGTMTVPPFTALHEVDDFPAYRPAPVRWLTEPPTHEILIPLTRGTPAAGPGPG